MLFRSNYGVHSAEAAKAANDKIRLAKIEAQLKGAEGRNKFATDIYESDARKASYGETARHNREMEGLYKERQEATQEGQGTITANQALGKLDTSIAQIERELKAIGEGKGVEDLTDEQIKALINSKQQEKDKYKSAKIQILSNPSMAITADMLPNMSMQSAPAVQTKTPTVSNW